MARKVLLPLRMKLGIRSVGCEVSAAAHEHARSSALAGLAGLLPDDAEVRLWLAWDGPVMTTPTMCTIQVVGATISLFERAMAPGLFDAIDIAVHGTRRRLSASMRGTRVA